MRHRRQPVLCLIRVVHRRRCGLTGVSLALSHTAAAHCVRLSSTISFVAFMPRCFASAILVMRKQVGPKTRPAVGDGPFRVTITSQDGGWGEYVSKEKGLSPREPHNTTLPYINAKPNHTFVCCHRACIVSGATECQRREDRGVLGSAKCEVKQRCVAFPRRHD